MGQRESDFSPKIFVLGRENALVSPMIELVLKEEQSRFGVRSAGIEPSGRLRSGLMEFLLDYQPEAVDLDEISSDPIGAVLNDHVQLVAYLSREVRRDAPIIATTGESVTLETESLRRRLNGTGRIDAYYEAMEDIREDTLPAILEPLGLDD